MNADEFDFARPKRRGRMTVSLDPRLAEWVRSCAARNRVPMSAVVELALRKAQRLNGEAPTDER